jgi:DNA invertase Pin-like site-specific DNA recombinase
MPCWTTVQWPSADIGESGTVDPDPLADRGEFQGRLSRLFAAAAADMDSEFARERLEASLQRADHARGDAGGMPIHAHDRAKRLKPERMSEAAQQLVAAIVKDDRLADDGAEPAHAAREPQGHPPAMQRQIGAS